ncbi:MAG: ATP-binding protein, partial [Cyanobacteria bacterium]|nr:ATP-binding protein [Cyanobacteriota bacterium]
LYHELNGSICEVNNFEENFDYAKEKILKHPERQYPILNMSFKQVCEKSFKSIILSCKRFQMFLAEGLGKQGYKAGDIFNRALQSVEDNREMKQISLSIEGLERIATASLQIRDYKAYFIFSNLLQNAVKYSPAHGAIQVKFDLVSKDNKPFLSCTLQDNGIGIPANEINNVKEGNRGSNALQQNIPGTGYGLQKVTKLLKFIHQPLEIQSPIFDSATQPGTRIHFSIPLRQD